MSSETDSESDLDVDQDVAATGNIITVDNLWHEY
jgi:hypothetical protein